MPPFEIERAGQTYRSATELEIDLAAVEDGAYRVLAVHNFQVEDRDPDLTRCAAGIFLAGRRRDGSWEVPERFPVECRTLAVLATVDVRGGLARLR